jgi:uncharacterized protein
MAETAGLRISRGLDLSYDFVTKTCGILAKRRVGKTYTASVIAEELVSASIPFVALDPTGAWWGLRSSANGKGEGLPVVILGGRHGDLPLERGAGKFIADLVVEHPGYYVLDFSGFSSDAADREFATAFAERLYRRKAEPGLDFPMQLLIDEADKFAPQQVPSGDQRMLGAFEVLVRRGGLRGIGTTLITQRAAVINKNLLEQLDILICLRTSGPNDRKAIEGYVKAHGSLEERQDMMGSLASLALGEAWVWEPGGDPPIFKHVQIRQRRTFNSSATPKVGEQRIEPTRLAAVDLADIKERMSEFVERADAQDPVKLHARIRQLERELAQVRAEVPEPQVVTVTVETPVVPVETLERLEAALHPVGSLGLVLDEIRALLEKANHPMMVMRAPDPIGLEAPYRAPAHASTPPVPQAPKPRRVDPEANGNGSVTPARQRILDALAWLESVGVHDAHKVQLALMAGASPKSSGYGNNLGALRSGKLIDYPATGRVMLTDEGRAMANAPARPPTTEDLHARLAGSLPPARWRILQELIAVYPEALPKLDLATRSGVSAASSGYGNNLGALRSLGFIDYPRQGYVVALPVLFLDQ